jgi:hypothetical protein
MRLARAGAVCAPALLFAATPLSAAASQSPLGRLWSLRPYNADNASTTYFTIVKVSTSN